MLSRHRRSARKIDILPSWTRLTTSTPIDNNNIKEIDDNDIENKDSDELEIDMESDEFTQFFEVGGMTATKVHGISPEFLSKIW